MSDRRQIDRELQPVPRRFRQQGYRNVELPLRVRRDRFDGNFQMGQIATAPKLVQLHLRSDANRPRRGQTPFRHHAELHQGRVAHQQGPNQTANCPMTQISRILRSTWTAQIHRHGDSCRTRCIETADRSPGFEIDRHPHQDRFVWRHDKRTWLDRVAARHRDRTDRNRLVGAVLDRYRPDEPRP